MIEDLQTDTQHRYQSMTLQSNICGNGVLL